MDLGSKFDRRLNILVILGTVLVVVVVGGALLAVPKIISTDSTATAIDNGTDIQGCRATYRAQLIDERMGALFIAKARLDEATNLGLEASVRGDDDTLNDLLGTLGGLRDTVDAAATDLEEGIVTYGDLITQSTDDPKAFLAGCG